MKKLLLLFIFIPSFLMAQEGDWFPIPSDQVTYFKRNLAIYTMKIDSIRSVDTALIYYNLRSPEQIGGTEEVNYYDPYTSWLGKYISVQEDVITFFSIPDFEKMPVYYKRRTSEPWRYITLDNGYYFEAFVDGFAEREITEGLIDSVKYIRFQAYDPQGNMSLEYACNDTMILSKHYGFAKVLDFGKWFYANWANKSVYGMEVDNQLYGYENKLSEYFNSYEVGNELHFDNLNSSVSKFKSQIKEKRFGEYYTEYDIEYCYDDGGLVIETKRFYPNIYPGQSILFDSIDGPQGIYRVFGTSNWNGYEEALLQFYDSYYYSQYNGQAVWAREISTGMCLTHPMIRVNELFWATEEDCPEDWFVIQYVHAGDFEYGEPYSFICETATNELVNPSISIEPNPSNGLFNIQSSKKIEELKVFNINGQLVWQVNELNKTQIDLSSLSEGLYLIKIQLEDNQVVNEKIMIQK